MDAAGQEDGEGDHHNTTTSDPKRAEILWLLLSPPTHTLCSISDWVYSSEECHTLPHKNGNDFCCDFNLSILQLVLLGWSVR